MEYEFDFAGVWVLTATSPLANPDSAFIDSFAMYNPHEKVSIGHNQHFHEAHKKKAVHDME